MEILERESSRVDMREFLLYSRTGYTNGDFKSLKDAGRLDIVYQCILTSIFKSAAHRHDVVFHSVLNGPPNPPVHITISGADLRDAHIDERSWEDILRSVLNGRQHPGISVDRTPMQKIVQKKHADGYKIFVLSDEGERMEAQQDGNLLFVLGDHIGLPKKDEGFVLRYGSKVSLGKEKYLAATSIDIVNYLLDGA